MAHRRQRVLALLGLTLALVGCGEGETANRGRVCTAAGCLNGVVVTVDEAGERPLEVCVGEVCSAPGGRMLWLQVPVEGEVEVVVRVAGGGADVDRTTATATRIRPNGPNCGPECRTVRLRLTVEDQLIPA